MSWRKSDENKNRYMAIIIHRRNSRKLRENSHMIFVLANASGYISSLVNILELLEKYKFGIVMDKCGQQSFKERFVYGRMSTDVNRSDCIGSLAMFPSK